jgi:hypothetical protein
MSGDCGAYLQPESFADQVSPGNEKGLCGETSLEQVSRQIADRATFLGAAVLQRLEGVEGNGDGDSLGSPVRALLR